MFSAKLWKLEIRNSGGLYGGLGVQDLGVVHPETRNAALVNIMEVMDKSDLSAAIVEFCKIPQTRQEIIDFVGMSHYYVMKKRVQPLIDQEILTMTMPDKPKSPAQKYITKRRV